MIYENVSADALIRQGDIFRRVPRIELPSDPLPVVTATGSLVEENWAKLVANGQAVTVVASLAFVDAIVITQDCDAVRSPYIALCQITDFLEVEPRFKDTKAPKSWASNITQHSRINQKWFYLPPVSTPETKCIGTPE